MVRLLTSGLYTSIQDGGRFGYRSLGVPISGAMDHRAMMLSNVLVGNPVNTAVMECTLQGPSLVFNVDATIAITGAHFAPKVNRKNVDLNTILIVKKGDMLTLGTSEVGVYGYVAVQGGWNMDQVLGSVSQFKGISSMPRLVKGAVLKVGRHSHLNKHDHIEAFAISSKTHIDAYAGPEFGVLTKREQMALEQTEFYVGRESNRMAYRLTHDIIINAPEIITAPVQPGTVQLTPSGDLMVLMRDAQTTGGYARVLQLTNHAVDVLSQKRSEETIRFNILT
ncbi:MAG: biotin-dependent carboxyltransferase family protein [Bacteroidetes bacterium]|nr:biotin-dependent carboxyltransferase family protein [Bacteroidota bacterium]